MASQNTTLYGYQVAGRTGSTSVLQAPSRDAGGKLRVLTDSYTTTSAVTAGSQTITLGVLPAGAKVLSVELLVPASVGTSSAKIGYFPIDSTGAITSTGADDDRWGSAVSLATAGRKQFLTVAADSDYVTTSEVAVVLSPVTTDFATAITFTFIIQYVIAS